MQKHFYLLLLSTLAIGFASGAYVKFLTHTPHEEAIPEPAAFAIEIVATEYGGCERVGCSMYRVTDTGEYTFVRYDRESGERFTGSLPSRDRSRLLVLFEQANLPALQETMFTGTCPITYDGPAYRYEIKAKGASYDIDTCRENVSSSLFISELQGLFIQFYEKHSSD